MSDFERACSLSELPEDGAIGVEVSRRREGKLPAESIDLWPGEETLLPR
jgi:hypothetical protein